MPIIAIAGNHDFKPDDLRALPWIYLEDECVEVLGLKVWGSPWSNPFGHGWAFNMIEEDQYLLFRKIPDDVDIIVSHGPPWGFRDTVSRFDGIKWDNEHVGSQALTERMKSLPNLKLVACGHIHPMFGKSGIVINGSLVNQRYQVQNDPFMVELD